MNDYLALLIGIICAGVGGELFVRGVIGIAVWIRVTPAIISVTVAAFATSSPELSIAINSALSGTPEISLGDALGSNVVNVALILALALLVARIHCPRQSIKRDFPVALLITVIIGLLLLDGQLSRVDGLLMLTTFFFWLAAVVREARTQRVQVVKQTKAPFGGLIVLICAGGLGLLIIAGNFIVQGARGIAMAFGINEFIVGATIVALGTSVPELATVVVARLRGNDDIGLGTILGSNILNGLLIIATAAVIHPIVVPWSEVSVTLGFGMATILCTYPISADCIQRSQGVLLLGLYAVFLAIIFQH